MRDIQLDDGCRLRFPNRGAEFCEGVEIGVLAALMDMKRPMITRWVSDGAVEQAAALALRLGYRAETASAGDGWTRLTLTASSVRPKLRVV